MKKVLFLLLFPILLFSQDYSNTINVKASSTVYVKANIIKFKIQLEETHSDSKEAYKNHKMLVNQFLELLSEYSIPDSSVSYSLLDFRKRRSGKEEEVFATRQEFIVKLNSIEDYTNFQMSLLDKGFTEFRSTFSTDQLSETKEQGYKEALELAREDASAIVNVMNKKLGEILEVNIRASENPHLDSRRGAMAASSMEGSARGLTEIEQSLEVRTNIEIRFEILDK